MGVPSFLRHALEGGTTYTAKHISKVEEKAVAPAPVSVIVPTAEPQIAKTITKPSPKKQAKKTVKKQKK